MKNPAIIAAIVILLAIGGAFLAFRNEPQTEDAIPQDSQDSEEIERDATTFSSPELGFEFAYPTGPEGYVMEERDSQDQASGLLRTFILMRTEDKANIENAPVGGEGAPVIAIQVFQNAGKAQPRAWAEAHPQYSTINLKMGEISETVIGGANAIRYRADGLYASENVVVAHGENVYVATGMFLDEDSPIARDFAPIVESLAFIPAPEQE